MGVLLQDLGYAFRQLRKTPGFTVTVLLTLALGIGANSAIFTLVNAILLHNLPVTDPKTLIRIGDKDDCCVNGGWQRRRGLLALFHRHLLHVQEEPAGVRRAGSDGVRLRLAAHYRAPRRTTDHVAKSVMGNLRLRKLLPRLRPFAGGRTALCGCRRPEGRAHYRRDELRRMAAGLRRRSERGGKHVLHQYQAGHHHRRCAQGILRGPHRHQSAQVLPSR